MTFPRIKNAGTGTDWLKYVYTNDAFILEILEYDFSLVGRKFIYNVYVEKKMQYKKSIN